MYRRKRYGLIRCLDNHISYTEIPVALVHWTWWSDHVSKNSSNPLILKMYGKAYVLFILLVFILYVCVCVWWPDWLLTWSQLCEGYKPNSFVTTFTDYAFLCVFPLMHNLLAISFTSLSAIFKYSTTLQNISSQPKR